MTDVELMHLKDARLLAKHIFELVQKEIRSENGYDQMRQVLSDIAELVRSQERRVSNLQVQLRALCCKDMQSLQEALEKSLSNSILSIDENDASIFMLVPRKTFEAFYAALTDNLQNLAEDTYGMYGDREKADAELDTALDCRAPLVKEVLLKIGSLYKEHRFTPQSEEPRDVQPHHTFIESRGASPSSLSRQERRQVIDNVCDLLKRLGIDCETVYLLEGSLWIVLRTAQKLEMDKELSLERELSVYIRGCVESKKLGWIFAQDPEVKRTALVPPVVLNLVRFASDICAKLKREGCNDDFSCTWLDVLGLKDILSPTVVGQQLWLLVNGQELDDDHLLRTTTGLQIVSAPKWESLAWHPKLVEPLAKLPQRLPLLARTKGFQHLCLAIHGLCCTQTVSMLSNLSLQVVRDLLERDAALECVDPFKLLKEVLGRTIVSYVIIHPYTVYPLVFLFCFVGLM